MITFGRLVRTALACLGLGTIVLVVWLLAGWPFFFDRLLVQSDEPMPAAAIVCITGGIADHNLPTGAGWDRLYTAVQLYVDGYAPTVVFTGGAGSSLSEAEIYAEAAQWLGLPREAIALEPHAGSTAEHPLQLLDARGLGIARETPLNIVTSPLHSKRTALVFAGQGFTNFRLVVGYVAKRKDPARVRSQRRSAISEFRANEKSYSDPVNRLRWRGSELLTAVREAAALGWYWVKGYV